MGTNVSTIENYKGVDIEMWHIPNVGYLYHTFIKGTHCFFNRYRDAKIKISIRSKA